MYIASHLTLLHKKGCIRIQCQAFTFEPEKCFPYAVLRIRDVIPDPDFYPSRIQ
jgi:hypothetical protein